jgi:uncharacterized protein YxjI
MPSVVDLGRGNDRSRSGVASFGTSTKGAVMALLRGRRDEAGTTRYRMQEKLFAIGDDFWIENEAGERAFKVNGKALRVRDTLVLESPSGAELYSIQQKLLHIRDTMEIERDGRKVATVKKALVTPLRDRFSIDVEDGEDMEAKGNILDHEYKIERGGDEIAQVSRRWFRVRDTYGVEVKPGQDDVLVLAAVVCIDQMTQDVG